MKILQTAERIVARAVFAKSRVCQEPCLPRAVFAKSRVCQEPCLPRAVFAKSRVCQEPCLPRAVFAMKVMDNDFTKNIMLGLLETIDQ